MKKLLLCALIVLGYVYGKTQNPSHFFPKKTLHDVYVNGALVHKGRCHDADEATYALIAQVLDQYNRSITLADLNASNGLLAYRIAHEYRATCVLLSGESRNGNEPTSKGKLLYDLCDRNTTLPSLMLLDACVDIHNLVHLVKCEHFDVVLAFDILHAYGTAWRAVAEYILQLGESVIIKTPDSRLKPERYYQDIEAYIYAHGGIWLGMVEGYDKKHPKSNVYVIYCHKTLVEKNCWGRYFASASPHVIESDFYRKTVYKHGTSRQWYDGINIMTFRALNGMYPPASIIYDQFRRVAALVPKGSSIIVQGKKLHVLR